MNWLNLFLMGVLSLGNFAIVVAVVNRVHVIRFHLGTLSLIRRSHILLIIGFTVALIGQGGFGPAQLLFEGRWLDLSPIYLLYFVLCGFSAICAATIVIRRWFARPPSAQLSNRSETIDIARVLGKKPVARGTHHWLTYFPGNEVFQVELVRKELHLPRLPPLWDGLTISHVSDTHFIGTITREYFEEVFRRVAAWKSDLVVFTGDLLDDQSLAEWLPSTVGQLQAPLGCYFILGNHDWELQPDAIREAMSEIGWIDLADRHLTLEYRGQKLLLAGSEYPWMGDNPDISDAGKTDLRILLSHTPDNYRWARKQGFDLMLSGHNHGGQVRPPGIGPIYTPSIYGSRYASGLYHQEPTLLYVSRGLSGKEPLRYNCPPEVSQIILRQGALAESPQALKSKMAIVAAET